jgi:hypothetical protein
MKISKSFRKSQRRIIKAGIAAARTHVSLAGLEYLHIKSTKNADFMGSATCHEGYAILKLNRKLRGAELFTTTIHELVHVSQFLRGDLDSHGEDSFVWRGQVFKFSDAQFQNMTIEQYKALPWEAEAYAIEGLYE